MRTIIGRGTEWGIDALDSGFRGMHETDEDVEFLITETITRFHQGLDPDITWYPTLSELHGPVGTDPEKMIELRDRITQEVWDEWVAGAIGVI